MSKKLNKFHRKWMFWNSVLSIATALIPLYFLFEMRKIALPVYRSIKHYMLYFNHSNFKKAQSAGKLYEFGRYEKNG